jgi:hypothetical protein
MSEAKHIQPESMRFLPVKPGNCEACGADHPSNMPHNPESLYYGMRFQMQYGRGPTWADACAHLPPKMVKDWKKVMKQMGHKFTVTSKPIVEPYRTSDGTKLVRAAIAEVGKESP